MRELESLIHRLERLVERAESLLPPPPASPDWNAVAFRWRGRLEPVRHPHSIRLADLKGVDEQKAALERNTRQFVAKRPANNVLLTGARGTGKSSLIKGVLTQFAKQGLRLIEVDRDDLVNLPEIIDLIAGRPERFVVFCDDLSFEASEPGYKALKSALDGSIAAPPDNLLIYATSNRRHLMPERFVENRETLRGDDDEIHPGETTEEKVSLSERFGLWLSFYPFSQEQYLEICAHWLAVFGVAQKSLPAGRARWCNEALQWALQRGSRSGRVAWQFARDYAGRHG